MKTKIQKGEIHLTFVFQMTFLKSYWNSFIKKMFDLPYQVIYIKINITLTIMKRYVWRQDNLPTIWS